MQQAEGRLTILKGLFFALSQAGCRSHIMDKNHPAAKIDIGGTGIALEFQSAKHPAIRRISHNKASARKEDDLRLVANRWRQHAELSGEWEDSSQGRQEAQIADIARHSGPRLAELSGECAAALSVAACTGEHTRADSTGSQLAKFDRFVLLMARSS